MTSEWTIQVDWVDTGSTRLLVIEFCVFGECGVNLKKVVFEVDTVSECEVAVVAGCLGWVEFVG